MRAAAATRDPVVLFIGQSGTGKSHALMERAASRPRVILLDPELTPLEPPPDGYELVTLLEAHQLIASRRRAFRAIVVHTPGVRLQRQLDLLAKSSFAVANATPPDRRLPLTLVVDEWHAIFTEGGISRRPMPAAVSGLFNQGRKRRISVIAAAQRYTHFQRDVRAQAGEVHLFRQTEETDLADIRRDRGAELAAAVRGLPDRERIVVATKTGEWTRA